MRIAIFTETFLPKWDGIANTLCYLLEHLAKRGHECIMFAPEGAPPQYAETKIIGLPSFAFPLYPDLKLVPPVMNVAEELDTFKPDLVHLVNLASLGLVGMRHARERDLPVAASYHTDLPGYTRLYGIRMFENTVWTYFRWLHNQADLNFCPSTYTKTELANHGFERLAVWGRGVDTEHYSPKHRDYNWRVKLTNGAPDSTLLLYTGRLAMEKRIDWVRPVMDLLPDIRFAVVGDGPLREELEEKFAGTHTVFTGYLRGDDLARAYAAGDIFVFPSPSETFGNVVLEAMASGMPVVAAGAGGPVDHVFHKQNGMISDPEDPADFVALVWELATNKPLATKLAANARAYAESQTWDMILDKLVADWAKLLKDYHAKPGNRAGSML